MSAANFFLLGTKLFYGEERGQVVCNMLEGRAGGMGGFVMRALGALQMLAFDGGVRGVVGLLFWNPLFSSGLAEFCVFVASSFLLSFKVLSVWTCTTQGGSFVRHVGMAARSPLLLVGFGAPLELLRCWGGGRGVSWGERVGLGGSGYGSLLLHGRFTDW